MKRNRSNLSKLELRVMKPFWSSGEMTVREAANDLSNSNNDPGYSTVQTIVGRLEAKGALKKTKRVGKAWYYKATVARNRIVNRMVDELVALLDGTSSPIISHLFDSQKISAEDLSEIRKMISKMENERDDNG